MLDTRVQEALKVMEDRRSETHRLAGEYALKVLTGKKEDKESNEILSRKFQAYSEVWLDARALLYTLFEVSLQEEKVIINTPHKIK